MKFTVNKCAGTAATPTTPMLFLLLATLLLVVVGIGGGGTQHASATMVVVQDPPQHHSVAPQLLRIPVSPPTNLLRTTTRVIASSPIPSTIVGGYTVCQKGDMCEVAATGTTLNVNLMTKAAALAGNASAVFEACGLVFQSTLSIDCFAGTPMGNGARLTVLIANGSSVATKPLLQFIVIRGALGVGSSVSIVGGTYSYIADGAALLVFNGGLTLSAASSVSITAATILHTNGILNGSSLFLARSAGGGDLTMSGGSSLLIENNNFIMKDTFASALPSSVIGGFQWITLQVDGALTMSQNSSTSVSMNRYDVTNVSGWALQVLYTNVNNGIQLTTSSHVQVDSNYCGFQDLNLTSVSGTASGAGNSVSVVAYVGVLYNGVGLLDSSTISINNNALLSNAASSIYTLTYRPFTSSVLSVNGVGSALVVKSNAFQVTGNSSSSSWFSATLKIILASVYVSPMTVENGGAVTISGNSHTIDSVMISFIETNFLSTAVSAVFIKKGGAISIIHNAVELLNTTAPSVQINGFVSYLGPLEVSGSESTFDLSFNHFTLKNIVAGDMFLWLFRLETYNNITQVDGGGTLSMSNNRYAFENISSQSSFQWNPIYTSTGDYDFVVSGEKSNFVVENNFAVGNVDVSYDQETPPRPWRFSTLNLLIIDTTLLVIDGAAMSVTHNNINVTANYLCSNTSNTVSNVRMEAVLMRLSEVSDTPSGSTTFTYSSTTSAPIINISTCRNYASGKQCHIVQPQASNDNVSYDCLTGMGADRVGVDECTYTPSLSVPHTPTNTLPHTLTLPRTTTLSRIPPPAPTTTTAPCDGSAVSIRRAELPLFTTLSLSPEAVQSGSTTTLPTTTLLNATISLLLANNLTTGLSGITYTVVSKSVSGNADGFASHAPEIKVTVLNTSAVQIDLSALPDYRVLEGESLDLYLPASEVEGSACVSPSSTPLLVGTITTVVSEKIGTSPSAVTTTIVSGGAVAAGVAGGMAGMAAEQQGLSALVMYNCADPKSRNSFGSYRALSPFAIFESYAGVVLGNVIAVSVVALVQLVIFIGLRICRPSQWVMEHMSKIRFPNFTFNVAFTLHTGTAFAASQLVSMTDEFEPWEVAIGGIAFAYAVLFPVFLMLHPYLRIARAYQEYENEEWFSQRKWPALLRFIVPQGSIHNPETRRAYGSYISSYRAPAVQIWWTSFPTWTSTVIGIGGLFHPKSVAGCQALFIIEGILFIFFAVLTVWRNPLRSTAASYLNAAAKIIMGAVLLSLAVSLSGIPPAVDAVVALGIIQTAFTILRVIHSLVCQYFDSTMVKLDVTLRTVWSHIPASAQDSKKLTQVFSIDDGGGSAADLRQAAATRNATDTAAAVGGSTVDRMISGHSINGRIPSSRRRGGDERNSDIISNDSLENRTPDEDGGYEGGDDGDYDDGDNAPPAAAAMLYNSGINPGDLLRESDSNSGGTTPYASKRNSNETISDDIVL